MPRCRGIRLSRFYEGHSTPVKHKPLAVSEHRRSFGLRHSVSRRRPLPDSDSDSDDDAESTMVSGNDFGLDIDSEESEDQNVFMATGITHEHPYAWALDGRLAGENGSGSGTQHLNVSYFCVYCVHSFQLRSY